MCELCKLKDEEIARLTVELVVGVVRHIRLWQLSRELPLNAFERLGDEWHDRVQAMIGVGVDELGGWDAAEPLIERRLDELRRMPYREYLRSTEWRTTRRFALDHAEGRCQLCNRPGRLDVHHRTYERRGNELLADLTVLCRPCHTNFHTSPGPDANQVAGARVLPLPPKGAGLV
jgi:hypothetical protein